jgi:quercetin dioxygenase-like cupin family protein
MLVKRFADAKSYEAPNHRDVRSLRLQGFEPDGPKNQWVGLSYYLPGAGAGPDSSPIEKVYVILDGELTLLAEGKEIVLRRFDSCTIPAGMSREVVNRSNDICTMLVVMPYPPEAQR